MNTRRDIKVAITKEGNTKTVVILVSGKFQINLTDNSNSQTQKIILEKLGDYIPSDTSKQDYSAEALKDTLRILFRWPSKRD